MAPAGVSAQRPPNGEPQAAVTDVAGTKRDLTTWWKQFKKNSKRDEETVEAAAPGAPDIFGVPLNISIKYASVAISLTDETGKTSTYGYVPIVVAKCGIYLKEKATDVEGIFRLAGAERRIKELMAIFNTPERYGKGLDWTGYTVHDAANLLRRYINSLPEPIIPLASYETFRDPLRNHQAQAVGTMELQSQTDGNFDIDAIIRVYQQLVMQLPQLNRQMLLYLLDLLAVFSSKSETNRMTAPNLAAIFQPGILHHPSHHQAPSEYRLSQDVLIFLIENQDHFIIGMPGTATDDKVTQDIQSTPDPVTARKGQQTLGRSTSSASAASQSVRRFGDIRRNASTNSRGSRQSNQSPSPVTPPPASPYMAGSRSSGVHRSNTLPSKKSASPALSTSERFQRFQSPESPIVANPATPTVPSPLATSAHPHLNNAEKERITVAGQSHGSLRPNPSPHRSPLLRPFTSSTRNPSQDRQLSIGEYSPTEVAPSSGRASPIGTPTRERGLSSFWKQGTSEGEKREGRRHNRLQKKRPDGITTQEPHQHSSQQSLSEVSHSSSPAIPPSGSPHQTVPSIDGQQTDSPTRPAVSTVNSFHTAKEAGRSSPPMASSAAIERDSSSTTLKPGSAIVEHMSSPQSAPHSKADESAIRSASTTSFSTTENEAMSQGEEGEGIELTSRNLKRDRWRKSLQGAKKPETNDASMYGSSTGAERSTSSVGSNSRARRSLEDESNQSTNAGGLSASEAEDRARSPRRGPLGWFKGKLQERQEKKEEKDRAKSPTPQQADRAASSQSLNAIAARERPVQQQTPATAQETPPVVSTDTSAVQAGPAPTPAEVASTQGTVDDTSHVMTPKASDQAVMELRPELTSSDA